MTNSDPRLRHPDHRPSALRSPIAAVALGLVLAAFALLAGCGSSGSDETTSGQAQVHLPKLTPAQRAPKGASMVEREIYRSFPPPKPDPKVPKSGPAIRAGEQACQGKSPVEVKEEFYAQASPHLLPEQKEIIAEIGRFAKRSTKEPGFTAGQLGADVYKATLPVRIATYGYQGCVYSLAKGLKHELAQERKSSR
jgi:hypothetical protein